MLKFIYQLDRAEILKKGCVVMKCPKCGLEEHLECAEFCQECGTLLTNFCPNGMCDLNNGESVPLAANAKFCYYCGSPSSFNEEGFFDKK